jgi:hypothetical protein
MLRGIFALALTAFVLIDAPTHAASSKAKPWQWTPEHVEARLIARDPIVTRVAPSRLLWASCKGQGRGVPTRFSWRFSRFTCKVGYGLANAPRGITLTVRVRPVGTGKICVVPGSVGIGIKPETACR